MRPGLRILALFLVAFCLIAHAPGVRAKAQQYTPRQQKLDRIGKALLQVSGLKAGDVMLVSYDDATREMLIGRHCDRECNIPVSSPGNAMPVASPNPNAFKY